MEQMSKEEVNDLAKRAKEDESSFALLYENFLEKAMRYAYWKLGSKEKAEDVTSEVFFRLVKKLPQYDETKDFQPWFYTILRNCINDELRRNYRKNTYLISTEPESLDKSADQSELEANTVAYALSLLPGDLRNILEMSFVLEMTVEEIAQEIGISVKSVYRKRTEALKKCNHLINSDS